jgi:tryptophan 2,3-dioxygenase
MADPSSRAEDNMRWQVAPPDNYTEYLALDRLLSAQRPRSGVHDEMLFIIIHQTQELWMKLFLHELRGAMAGIRADQLDGVFKMLSRIARIQIQLVQSWDVLSTMTPLDYAKVRPHLASSSGLQSFQYRLLEFMIGHKDAALINVHRSDHEHHQSLQAALDAPSLYDEVMCLLARRGLPIPAGVVGRVWSQPYVPSKEVEAAWHEVYKDAEKHWDLYDLAEKLVDLEDRFQQWRFRHLKTVERIIGWKTGTGGSSGVPYLAKALDLRFFPELWSVRTVL